MSVRKIEQIDRAPTTLDLKDRELSGAGISCMQPVQVTLQYQDVRDQRFVLHPLQGRGHMKQRDHHSLTNFPIYALRIFSRARWLSSNRGSGYC